MCKADFRDIDGALQRQQALKGIVVSWGANRQAHSGSRM